MNKKKTKNILIVMFLVIGVLTRCNANNIPIENNDIGTEQDEVKIDIEKDQNKEIDLVDVGQEIEGFDVPDYVLSQASKQVENYYEDSLLYSPESEYSNWRIESLEWAYTYDDLESLKLDIYRINFEFLTEAPEKVVMAGGMYITEDNWVCPTYPNCTYLIFDANDKNFSKELLFALMENDCFPGDETFTSDLIHCLSNKK